MATLTLQSATVLPDGRVLRLVFEASPVPAAHGMPDWRPGFAQGARLALSTGADLEFVGAWATPYDRPVDYLYAGPAGDPATSPLPGEYHVAYSLVRDSDGVEEFFSTPVAESIATAGGTLKLGRLLGVHAIPVGYTANVYVSQPDGGEATMALYRAGIPYSPTAEAEPAIDDRVWDAPGTPWPGPARLTWTAHWLITDPDDVATIAQSGLTVTGGAGLLADAEGNATAAFTAAAVANGSLVDADGFTSDLFTRGPGGVTVYVSSTHGDDGRDLAAAQDPTTPVATLGRADELLGGARANGSAIRVLRGDTVAVPWGLQLSTYGGPDRLHPAVFESYWDDSFGPDPGTRPVLEEPDRNALFFASGTGGLANVVMRGLHLKAGRIALNASRGVNGLTLDDNILEVDSTVLHSARVTFLRNILRDIYSTAGMVHGIYMDTGDDALISQNALDVVGRESVDLQDMSVFSHAIYHQYGGRPLVLWGNLIREAEGVQMRGGGVAAYNVFSRVANSAYVASPGGYFTRNVIEKCGDIVRTGSATAPRGRGLQLGNTSYTDAIAPGTVAEFNLVVNEASIGAGIGLVASQAPGLVVRNNTIARAGPVLVEPGIAVGTPSYVAARNIVHEDEGEIFYENTTGGWSWYESDANLLSPPANGTGQTSLGTLATWKATTGSEAASVEADPGFVDATADLGDWHATLGGDGSEAAYVAAVRGRAAGAWGDAFDMRLAWAFYGMQYRPASEPAGTGSGTWDYYGAADYREGEPQPPVRRRFRGRRHV